MSSDELLALSVGELADRVRQGAVSATEVAEASLARAEAKSDLGAFLHIAERSALAAAQRIDERRRRGEELGVLAGVPIAVKDALCTTDMPTTCASRILARKGNRAWCPPYDATVVARLRAADAIVIGKTNMDEFAMGSSNENSAFGPVKNPHDPTRIPGGSSGGSAVAVAAGVTPASLGSDTGGSIRQPAGLCGVVGLKPSYGRVSRYGLVAFASSLDQVGPYARDVRGAARLLEVIGGADPRDSTCRTEAVPALERACNESAAGLTIGVPSEYFGEGLDSDVDRSVRQALTALEASGCKLREVSLPHTRYGVATYYVIATAEASSNLARFDGVRFGLRIEPSGADLEKMYGSTRDEGFGAEVKRRILLGTYVLSAGYYDAYYKRAQQVRTLVRRDFEEAFRQVDVIVTPTSPVPAFRIGERVDDPLSMYLSDIYTLPASLAGICALSVPAATTPKRDDRPALPVGLQIMGPALAEESILRVAAHWEKIR